MSKPFGFSLNEHHSYLGHFKNEEVLSKGHNNWIKGAIKHKGALTRSAKKAGESPMEFAEEHKHDSGTTGRRARLALTLRKMHK